MENSRSIELGKQDFPEPLPPLIKSLASNEVFGFDTITYISSFNNQDQANGSQPLISPAMVLSETVLLQNLNDESLPTNHQKVHPVSISMPTTPLAGTRNTKKVLFVDNSEGGFSDGFPDTFSASETSGTQPNHVKCYSQPMPNGCTFEQGVNFTNCPAHTSIKRLKDKRYDSFKTWSGKLQEDPPEYSVGQRSEKEALHVDRYFDALEGPELEKLRPAEQIVLPEDKTWPFLLRYPVSSFGICLGVSSQAIMWKALATSGSTKFLHISLAVNLVLWCISVALVAIVASIYLLKVIIYFEAVRREYYHPIRVNFFFAPWIALLFLALGMPPSVARNLPPVLWYILMAPILCLELKIYGQWMSGGQRRLSKVANPSNHLSVVGNFVGALLGASMGLKEGPIFFFAVGLAHYSVLFVTLYQRLPTNETLPKDLHPVFFLFVAAPSVASMAWAKIQGSFDYGSRIAYFVAVFLYFSLAVRVNFFRGFKFSLAWWAYTFPMTGAAIATIRYSSEVTNVVTCALAVILSSIATLTVTALLVTTILHAFVLRDLFPNDIAIAISDRKPKHHNNHHIHMKWFHRRNGSTENKEIEHYLKFATSDCKDVEACPDDPSPNSSK